MAITSQSYLSQIKCIYWLESYVNCNSLTASSTKLVVYAMNDVKCNSDKPAPPNSKTTSVSSAINSSNNQVKSKSFDHAVRSYPSVVNPVFSSRDERLVARPGRLSSVCWRADTPLEPQTLDGLQYLRERRRNSTTSPARSLHRHDIVSSCTPV